MTIEQQAATALKWTALSKALSQAVTWVVTFVVVRLLSPDDYGLMAICAIVVSLLSSVAELGLGASVVQRPTLDLDELRRVTTAVLLLNLGLGALVAAGAPLMNVVFDDVRLVELTRVSALHFVLNGFSTIPLALATRQMRFKWLSSVEFVAGLITSFTTLALAWSGAGVWALVLGSLVGACTRTVLLIARDGAPRPTWTLRGVKDHVNFGSRLTMARLLWQFVYQLDVLIAGRLLSKEALGAYSVSLHLATLPMQKMMSVLNQVAFPTVARLRDDLPRLRLRLIEATRLLMFVSVPTLWGISAVAPDFVPLVLGDKWGESILPLQLVTLVVPFRMLATICSASVSALGRADVDLRNMLVSAIVLPTAFAVGASWGIEGLALSWVVAIPLIFVVTFPRIRAVLGIELRELAASALGPVCGGVCMYLAVWGTRSLLGQVFLPYRLAASILVGAVSYLLIAGLLDRKAFVDAKRLAVALKG